MAVALTLTQAEQALGQQLGRIFSMCIQYPVAHCQISKDPLTVQDIPQQIKAELLACCSSQAEANYFLQDTYFRKCVFAKMICQLLEKHVLNDGSFAGFDHDHDRLVQDIRNMNFENIPVPVRKNHLDNLAASFVRISQRPASGQYMKQIVQYWGNHVWNFLQPSLRPQDHRRLERPEAAHGRCLRC